ncbi:hypothetical protein [Roseibium algae]|uniref:Uncharacterized protein n=1 Tax=Roseibium algae TaxID=3123038 RepID=A0ABU8TEP8_9HYPH
MTASCAGMSLEAFEDIIDRLGGKMSSWPRAEQLAAQMLLDVSPEANALLAEVNTMENFLSHTPPLRAPSGLADRITARAFQTSVHQNHPAKGLAEKIQESFSANDIKARNDTPSAD